MPVAGAEATINNIEATIAAAAHNEPDDDDDDDDSSSRAKQQRTELESIIEDAKRGDDANARLRHDLLRGHDGDFDKYHYDKHSYPWEYVWHGQAAGDRKGVPVEMNINFHRVFEVDIVDSVMDLVVWLRFVWVDPRLTWRPEEYGDLNETWVWIGDGGAGGETSEIWTPDVELWNLETGIRSSLEDAYARVSHDGTVWWGRPGHVRPTCKFYGLSSFPFDKLTCAMEFGSWMMSGKYVRMEPYGGVGFSMGGSVTAGESFEEYSFAKEDDAVSVEKHVYGGFASNPEEAWPVLLYNVTIHRSWEPYARGYIAVQIVLNFIGFCAFWLPPSCGERMGLSITAMLAALAAEIVIASHLPACAEMTWFAKFSILSMVFAFVSLLESVAVLYFYYKSNEDLVPQWYSFAKNWYLVRQATKHGKEAKRRSFEMAGRATGFVSETTSTAVDALHNATERVAMVAKEGATRLPNDNAPDGSWDGLDSEDDEKKSSGYAENGHADEVKDDRSAHVRFSGVQSSRSRRIGNINRATSCSNSVSPRDADDFNCEEELENNMKWKYVAARIDDVARFWIPIAFVIALAVVLAEVF